MASLKRAIAETKEYLQLNCDPDADDDDALDDLTENCGRMSDGGCSLAGTEYCDWECPFS
jgi:hypothetical protein